VAVLAAFGFTAAAPVIAALAAVFTVAALAAFLSDAGNRDWLATQLRRGVSGAKAIAQNALAMAQGDYIPPGLSGTNRHKYREAVHRYKKAHGLKPNQDVPKWILDQIADDIKQSRTFFRLSRLSRLMPVISAGQRGYGIMAIGR
jgi:hypothetical protein